MLGLNLNTNIPFSPVYEVMCPAPTPEEEVDVVTGNKDEHAQFTAFRLYLCCSKEMKKWDAHCRVCCAASVPLSLHKKATNNNKYGSHLESIGEL